MTDTICTQYEMLVEQARNLGDVKPLPPVTDPAFRAHYRVNPDPDAERDARLADEDIERMEAEENPDQEYCPVCGDEIEPGERYCSSQCEFRAIKEMFSEEED